MTLPSFDLPQAITLCERVPNAADIAAAERAYDAFAGRFGMAHDRADYIARLARMAMHKRLNEEARFARKDIAA